MNLPHAFQSESVFSTDEPPEPFTCSCQNYDGHPCFLQFSVGEVESARLQFLELSREELDMCVLSHLSSCMRRGELTQRSKQAAQSFRTLPRTSYFFEGQPVCRELFLYVHCMSAKRLRNLVAHFKDNGVVQRLHKGSKQKPRHALSFEDITAVVGFISNFAEANAIILPGRQPYGWNTDCKLLPTHCTKRQVYNLYAEEADRTQSDRKVSYRSFARLWQQLVPFITNLKPATDLC